MKKRVLSVAALLFGSVAVNAQVGIGTIKPNKSAELLIESANRGLLIPNVALLDTKDKTTISNGNVESLMVFATKSQGDITPGYYYWNINKWVRLTADKDIPGIVVNNFQEIVNMEGDKVQNIIKNIVRNTEGNVIYEGDKFYQVINKDGNIIKQEITDKITHIEYDDLTGDYIYYNENAVDRQGNIDKNKGVRIQVKQTVINKFKDIINDQTVQQHINNFLEGTYVGGNVYYDGTKFTYVTKAGETKEITIKEIVTANETVTTLVKNGDGTYTYTSENNTKTIIDIPSEFVEHFEKIIEQPVTVDGRTFTTINDYIKYVTESKGGFTKIVYNKDGDVIFQEWNETKQEWVNVDNSKFTTIVKSNETVTLLVPNANGTFTYYNEKQIGTDGQPKAGETGVTIDPKEVSVALNTTSNKYEFKNSKGDVIGEIDANANAIVYNDNSTNLGVTNVQEAIEKLLQKITEVAGTTGDLSVAGGLEFVEKTSGLGKLLADAKIQIADKGVTSEKLNAGTGDADRVGVADKDGNVVYKTLDEVVKSNETVTLLVPNANGTFTYYNEKQIGADGQPKAGETGVTIDPKEVSVALNTTSNKYEFKNSKGDVIGEIDANANAITFNNATNGFTSTNVQDALEELKNTINTNKGDLSVAGGLEFTSGTNGTTKLLSDAGIQIADKGVTSEKLNAGTGDADRVGVADKDGNVVYKTLDEVVKSNETVTLLVPNANGTFTYYNEKQIGADGQPKAGETGVTIDPKEVSVALNTTSNKYEFKNSKGDVIGEIDANANAITFNNTTNGFTSTNVQDALEELKNTINTNKGNLSVAGGLEFTSGTNGTTKLLSDAGIQIADKGVTSEKLNAGTGDADRVGVADKDGNVVYKTLDEVVKSNETVTLLVPNANGTFTYYNEKQIGADGLPKAGETGVTIDPKEVSVALNTTSNKYEFKNSKGDVIGEIDANANAITFNNTTNGFTSTNVQDALEELKNTINTNKGNLSVAGGLEFTSGTNGTTKLLSDAGIQIADKGVTSEKLNAGTGDADRVGVADKDGNVVYKTLDEVVKSNETVTLLVPNANGTFTYYNEKQIGADGQPKAGETGVTIDPKEVSVALNTTSNKYEFKNSKGDVIGEIDANANAITFNNATNGFTSTNVQDALEELKNTINTNKGDLSVAGGLEFTSGTNGTTKLLSDAGIQIADKGVTSEKLNAGTGDADRVGVADKDGNVVYKTLDEVVKSNETVTLLVPNANGTFTYYNEKQIGADGQPKAGETGVTIDPKEVSVALNTTSNKYEFKNSKGNVIGEIDANANAITFNNTTNGFTSTNVQDALEELKNTINTNKGDLSVAGGLEFTSGTNGTTKLLSDAGIQIADKGVTSEKLNAGTGDADRVGVADKDGNVVYKTLDEVVKSNETVTLLVPNANGTFTYYNEKQIGTDGQPKAGETGVTIDPKEVSVALNTTSNKYEFKNSKGDVIGEIDANANAIVYNDNSTNLGVTNVQEAIEKLLQKITEVAGTTGDLSVAGGLEFTSGTNGTTKLLSDAGIQIADKGVTSEKLNAGTGDADRVGVADKDGNVVYKTLDEVVKSNETVTLLVPNANGTFTYYNEKQIGADGQPKAGETGVTIDPKEVSVALNTTSNKYEFKNSKGDVIGEIDANANAITFNNATNGFTSTNVQDALEELKNTINTNKGDLSVAGGLEFTSGTNGTTKLLSDAGIQIADKGVTSEKLNAGTGDADRVGVADKDGNVVYKTLDEVVKSNETVTLLVPNANGTFTYYNEKQIGADGQPKAGETGVTIDPKEVSVALNTTSNKYEFKNSKGDVIGEIDANANAIVYNDNSTNLGVTNVQEAIEKLLQKITEVAGTTGDLSVAGGLEFTSGTNGTTKLLSDAGIQIADKGVTSEKLNAGTGDADRVGVADKDGNVVYKTLDEVVKSNETVTLLVPNANGTFTYYNEKQIGADGQPKAGETGVTIDPKEVSVALNTTSNKYEFKNSKGDVIGEIDANANAITFNNATNGFTSTNVQDALEELKNTINTNKGDLSVAGGLEFTSGTNGTTKLLSDAGIQIADKGVTSEKLNAGTGDADRVGVADKDGNVVYKTLDEVVKSNETVTLLVPNANGTFTYYNEKQIGADGLPKAGETGVTIDPKEVSVALNTTSNKYEFKNSKGDVIGEIDANANAIVYNDNSTNLGVTNVQEAIEKLLQKITEVAGTTGDLSVAGGLEFTSGTNGTTKLLSDAGIQIADKGVTSEKLNAGTGDADRVGVADKDGNVVYKTLDEVVKSNETVTLLVPNANGTFTYYNEKQIGADGLPKAGETGVTIDPKEVSVALNTTSNKYEFKNSKGDVIGEIDANANAITFNNTTNGFTSTNVQDALEELKNTINTNKGDLSVAGGLEFTGGTNGTTKLLSDAGIQIADKGVTSEKLGAKPEEQGKVATVNSDGSVSYKAIKVTDITEGKVMSSTSITIDQGGLGATLKDVSLEIKPGNAGQVMITGTDGKTTWVDQSVISPTTTNSLTSDKNLMTSDVNGVAKTANIINSVENTLDANNNMVTKVNGIASNPLDLTTAVQQGQKNTYVEQGTGITVSKAVSADGKETTYTVASNPSEITLNGDVTGTASTSVVEAIQGTKVSNVKPDSEGQALVYDAKLGLWKPGIPKVDVTDITDKKNLTAANGLDATIEVVTGGANAVLVETSLKVKEESITTKEIKNGTIKPEDIAKAGNNQVLVTNGSGIPTWSDQSDLGKVITSDNGLTKTDNNIQLGGILTKATVITTVTNNTLALEGLDKTKTQAVSKTDGITQHLLAVDKNGDIIKALKAAMPKFFYMPSVLVPTAESQVTQTGVSYNNATRTGSINLYSIYQSQFGTPIKSSVGATPLPVLPVSELGFHITYATEGVFTIESITAEGLMTYKVSSTANVNGGSFINIVFSVKEDN